MDEEAIWGDLVGDPWVRYADVIDGHSAPFGAAAIDALGSLVGATVIDVGCGVGGTTWQLADRVGPTGRVIGVDLSAPFVEGARARGSADHVSFIVADAAKIELEPVDALFSRFGVMFFADPSHAFGHLRSLVHPGGQVSFACWQDPFANPWMTVPVVASVPVLGPPQLPTPGTPGPFAFASAETIRSVLDESGWANVEITGLEVEQPFPAGDSRACAEVMIQINPVLAGGIREAPQRRPDLLDAVTVALGEYEQADGVVLPAAAWIVHATSTA